MTTRIQLQVDFSRFTVTHWQAGSTYYRMLTTVLRKVNIYPETVSDNGPEALRKGLLKTVVYAATMVLAFFVLVLRYSRRPNSIVHTIANPSAADYLAAAARSDTVTCPCTVTSMPLTPDIVILSLALSGWCNRPPSVTFLSQ